MLKSAWILSVSALYLVLWTSSAQTQDKKKETTEGNVTRGQEVFELNCEECHDAHSTEETVGPGLKGIKDGKLPSGKKATSEKVLDIINTGPAEMVSFQDRLTEQQKRDVVAYVMTL